MNNVNSRPKPDASPPILWIDSNEEAHHHFSFEASREGWNPAVMPLEVGDVRFFAQTQLWCVERKAAPSDLEASFKDGRLRTQHWKAVEHEVERLVICMEGDPNLCMLDPNVKHAVFSLQAEGTFIYWCRPGEFIKSMRQFRDYLMQADHSYLRRPSMPMPSLYSYLDKDFRRRVQTLMTYSGVTEKTAVEGLQRYTLEEINNKPELLREVVPSVTFATIRNMYHHLQKELPPELASIETGTKRKRTVRSMTSEEWIQENKLMDFSLSDVGVEA